MLNVSFITESGIICRNEDFAPTMPEGRTFSVYDMASLWVGLVVCVPTYYLAGSLVELGMSW